MYQRYSRRAPMMRTSCGPTTSTRSFSSRTYCWSFFQFSSRLASTWRMNSSRAVWASVTPVSAGAAARTAGCTGTATEAPIPTRTAARKTLVGTEGQFTGYDGYAGCDGYAGYDGYAGCDGYAGYVGYVGYDGCWGCLPRRT